MVLAAASLTDVCGELEEIYEEEHPGVDLIFSFGSSGALQSQIKEVLKKLIASCDEVCLHCIEGNEETCETCAVRKTINFYNGGQTANDNNP